VVRTELGKPSPSRLVVGSLLSSIGPVIRTVAALRPAYEMIRHVVAAFGYTLPPLP
jgi:hypothetical protein